MMMTILTAVVEVNTLIYFSFVKIRIFDADIGLETRILKVDLAEIETIGKRSILCLDITTNR
eukprot:scaffold20941_cov76-Skeletonema_dohrnii-CCMP3373.AAC.1